jgi:CCDC81-like prokaryotic HU domain 1/CCDC81-like prokaryotic HU domain 2
MELIDLVSELLYKHNCVIIPKFGGFVANFKPTEFEDKRLILSPSRKKVAFNQSLVENDGLLINSLVKKKQISYERAEKEVYLFSKFLHDRLEKYKNYEFKNIGSFYLNKENKSVFVAYEGLNFYKKSYGFQDVKVKRLSSVVNVEEKSVPKPKKVSKTIPIKKKDSTEWVHLPQIAASFTILVVVGLVLWQILGTTTQVITQNNASNGVSNDSPEQASILSDLILEEPSDSSSYFVEPEAINEQKEAPSDQPIIEEVTEQLIEEGKLPGQPIITPQEEPSIELEDDSAEQEEITPAPTYDRKKDLDAMYERLMRKDVVYYVAVIKYENENEVKNLVRKFSAKEYETFSLSEEDGSKHLCLDKFTNEDNARTYLSLVKRYDDRRAYLIEREE